MRRGYIALFLVGIIFFAGLSMLWPHPAFATPSPEIKVAGKTLVRWSTSLELQESLRPVVTAVHPRIVVTAAAGSSSSALTRSPDLVIATAGTGLRIIVDQAASAATWDVVGSVALDEQAASTAPRIVIEGAAETRLNKHLQGSKLLEKTAGDVLPRVITNSAATSVLKETGSNPPLP